MKPPFTMLHAWTFLVGCCIFGCTYSALHASDQPGARPDLNARLIYVSPTGSDAESGLSPDEALLTVERGFALLREGQGDWLLLERGSDYALSQAISQPAGASPKKPIVITSYGEGEVPQLDAGPNLAKLGVDQQALSNIRFINVALTPDTEYIQYADLIRAMSLISEPSNRQVSSQQIARANQYVVVRADGLRFDGRGSTLHDWPVNILADNVTIRNLRMDVGEDAIRAGGLKAVGADAISAIDSKNVVLEYLTTLRATDENIDISRSTGVTVRHCLIADPIVNGLHPKGRHGHGLLVNGAVGKWEGEPVTIQRNLFVRCDGRHPSVYAAGSVKDYADASIHVRIVNNVIYSPGSFASRLGSRLPELQGKGETVIDYVGNVIITTEETDLAFLKKCVQIAPWETFYQRDNVIVLPDGTSHDLFEWAGVADKPMRDTPNYPLPDDYETDPLALIEAVTKQAGSTPLNRHAEDQALIDLVNARVDAWE